MDEVWALVILQIIFNFIGATIRWIYGTVWRTIAGKQRFTFKEYLNGSKKSSDFLEEYAHGTNNVIIGVVFFFIIAYIIVKYNL